MKAEHLIKIIKVFLALLSLFSGILFFHWEKYPIRVFVSAFSYFLRPFPSASSYLGRCPEKANDRSIQ